jgi:hypothetical protein
VKHPREWGWVVYEGVRSSVVGEKALLDTKVGVCDGYIQCTCLLNEGHAETERIGVKIFYSRVVQSTARRVV